MTQTSFHIVDRPDMQANLEQTAFRGADGKIIPDPYGPGIDQLAKPAAVDLGGMGSYSTNADYTKFLTALITGKLVKPATLNEMLKPQLDNPNSCFEVLQKPENAILRSHIPAGLKISYGLGGILALEDLPRRQKSGSLFWGGLPNLLWWIDPKAGLTGSMFMQLMPINDAKANQLFIDFSEVLYSSGG